jgi:hypothetical protein
LPVNIFCCTCLVPEDLVAFAPKAHPAHASQPHLKPSSQQGQTVVVDPPILPLGSIVCVRARTSPGELPRLATSIPIATLKNYLKNRDKKGRLQAQVLPFESGHKFLRTVVAEDLSVTDADGLTILSNRSSSQTNSSHTREVNMLKNKLALEQKRNSMLEQKIPILVDAAVLKVSNRAVKAIEHKDEKHMQTLENLSSKNQQSTERLEKRAQAKIESHQKDAEKEKRRLKKENDTLLSKKHKLENRLLKEVKSRRSSDMQLEQSEAVVNAFTRGDSSGASLTKKGREVLSVFEASSPILRQCKQAKSLLKSSEKARNQMKMELQTEREKTQRTVQLKNIANAKLEMLRRKPINVSRRSKFQRPR